MADEIIIETTSAEVIEVGVPGPQGPAGAAGTGLETLTVKGDTLYRGETTGERLPIGTTGQVLKVSAQGIPAWANESGAVTSVNGQTGAVTITPASIDAANDNHAHNSEDLFFQGLEILGAGNANVNGVYVYGGDLNGKGVYYKEKVAFIYWDGAAWMVSYNSDDVYSSAQNTTTPWQVTSWSVESGQTSPAPSSWDRLTGDQWEAVIGQRTNPTLRGTAAGKNVGTGANDVAAGNDSRFTDARQPLSHSSTHHTGGTDAIAPSAIGAAASGAITSSGLTGTGGGRIIGRITAGSGALAEIGVSSPLTFSSGNLGLLSGAIPTASTATPSASGTAAAGTSSNFARADHVHAMPTAADVGASATGHTHDIGDISIGDPEGFLEDLGGVLSTDARLSDSRTPSSHAASHASAGSDPLAPSAINAQTIYSVSSVTGAGTLAASRAIEYLTSNYGSSPYTITLPLAAAGSLNGDTFVFRSVNAIGANVTIQYIEGATPVSLATLTDVGQQFRFRFNGGANEWSLISVDSHPANRITSGTLDIARIPTGTSSTQVSLGNHSHGNINSSGQVGSDSGRVLVTTTAGAVTTLALGTANQVLRTKSDLSGVEFADPAASGVTSVTGTAPIVSSGGTTPAISISAATASAAGSMSSADKTKLDGISAGATANATDAQLRDRATHTGTQAHTTITGLGGAATLSVGTTTGTVAAGDDSRFHTRSHAITSTSDHTASNWSVFYSNGSGQVTELALGAANTVLTSNGASSAPSFAAASGGGSSIMQSIAVGFVLN